MIDKILRKIFLYIFWKYIKEQKLKLIKSFEKQTKSLEIEIRSCFSDYLDTNKYKVKQLITKESIEKWVLEIAEKEINSRWLACAVDFWIKWDDTQIILIWNHKWKHFVKSWNVRYDNIYQLQQQLDKLINEWYKVQKTFIDSHLRSLV